MLTHAVLLQVRTLLDAVTCSSLMKVVKTLAAPPASIKKSKQQTATDCDDMEIDNDFEASHSQADSTKANLASCTVIVQNLAILLESFGLRDQPDNMRAIVDALVETTRRVTTGASTTAGHAVDAT